MKQNCLWPPSAASVSFTQPSIDKLALQCNEGAHLNFRILALFLGFRGDCGVRADPGPEWLHERPALVAGADRDGPDRRDGQGQPEDQDQDHGVQRLRAVPQVHRRQRSHRGQNYQGFADFKIVGVTFFLMKIKILSNFYNILE